MSHFGQKAAMALVAFATVGSTLFGGAALANDEQDGTDGREDVTVTNTGGAGGEGGDAANYCVNVAVQVSVFNDEDGNQDINQYCAATGGAGGAGGDAMETER